MSCIASDILADLAVILATVSGLTDTGRVRIGQPDWTAMIQGPAAFVWPESIASRDDDQLGSYRRVLMCQCVVITPAGASDGAHVYAALDLADLVLQAIEAKRGAGQTGALATNQVRTIVEGIEVMAGAEINPAMDQQGIVGFGIVVEYITPSGTGV